MRFLLPFLCLILCSKNLIAGMYNDSFDLGRSYELPKLEFYDNKEFKNNPVMILNEEGLFFKDKLVCKREKIKISSVFHSHDGKQYHPGDPKHLSSFNRLDNCPGTPISRLDEIDIPEATRYSIEFDSINKNIMEATYQGNKLYLNLDSFKRKHLMPIQKSAEKELLPGIKKLLEKPSYQTFVKEMKVCLHRKDQKCLSQYIVSMNNENEVGDLEISRFGRGRINPKPELTLNKTCDGKLESERDFAICIVNNEILIDQLIKCLEQKTFADFYEISPGGRKLKCFFYEYVKGFKFVNFFSAKYSDEPSQFDKEK